MDIAINNCNNIIQGAFSIIEGRLNIKYAINGTGKSTIARAISTASSSEGNLNDLIPYKFMMGVDGHAPSVTGLNEIHSVMTFNEEYVNKYVYQPDELIEDSFSIFVKTTDYDAHMNAIEKLLQGINVAFQNHPELDSLIQSFSQFIEGFGKATKSGYSAAGAINKALGNGNKINNVPKGLEAYAPYLNESKNATNVKWLRWQISGKPYLDMAEQCPYCSSSIETKKDSILMIAEKYDAKSVEYLNKMLQVFDELLPYFDEETKGKIREITDNVDGITETQQSYLIEIKTQVASLLGQLNGLKQIGFHTLKNTTKISDEIKKYRIELSYYTHLMSKKTEEKVNVINDSLKTVLDEAGKLQGEVAQQNRLVKKTIEDNRIAINDFLQYAGYDYVVAIEEFQGQKYRMILKPVNSEVVITSVKDHLSYGERNAFALVLFMFSELKENSDLIILDDPISSFDGNKKFAIINMLFLSNRCLKNKTVLLLTHEFNTVIDVIHTMSCNFNPAPKAAFLTTKDGILSEEDILKTDICSFRKIAIENINAKIDNLNKLVYLRRLLEIEGNKGLGWQLISNIFHKRGIPEVHGKVVRPMTEEEIVQATNEVTEYMEDFNYNTEYAKTQNKESLIKLYNSSESNYEKLQIYRIIFNDNNKNRVIKKFINETFHVENDYIFQLNPRKYDTVPQYVIRKCDKDILRIFIIILLQSICQSRRINEIA